MAVSCSVPPGFRFRPTDEELVDFFLPKKRKGESFLQILDRALYGDKLPWEVFTDDDPAWEFYEEGKSLKKTVYTFTKLTAIGANNYVRTAGCGTWDGKSRTQNIKNSRGEVIGHKRQFRFRTEKDEKMGRWIMHEYKSLLDKSDNALCKITVDDFEVLKDCLSSDVGCSSSDCDGSRKRKSSCVVIDSEVDDCIEKRARIIEEEENLEEKGDVDVLQILEDGLSVNGPIPDWLFNDSISGDIVLPGPSEQQQEEGDVNVLQISENGLSVNGPIPDWFYNDFISEDIVLPGPSEIQKQQEEIIPCAGSHDEDIMANTYYQSYGELLDDEGYEVIGQEQPFPDAGYVLGEEGTQLLHSTQTMDDATLCEVLHKFLQS